MNRAQVLERLTPRKSVPAERYGVTGSALFGSAARNIARDVSEVYILVSFGGPATSELYDGIQFHLEDLLGRNVDLVIAKAPRIKIQPVSNKRH